MGSFRYRKGKQIISTVKGYNRIKLEDVVGGSCEQPKLVHPGPQLYPIHGGCPDFNIIKGNFGSIWIRMNRNNGRELQ